MVEGTELKLQLINNGYQFYIRHKYMWQLLQSLEISFVIIHYEYFLLYATSGARETVEGLVSKQVRSEIVKTGSISRAAVRVRCPCIGRQMCNDLYYCRARACVHASARACACARTVLNLNYKCNELAPHLHCLESNINCV